MATATAGTPSLAEACPTRAPVTVPEPSRPPDDVPKGPVDTRFLRYPYEKDNEGFTAQVRRRDRYRAGRDVWARASIAGGYVPKHHGRARVAARAGTRFVGLDTTAHAVTRVRDTAEFFYGSANVSVPIIVPRLTVRFGGGLRYGVFGRIQSDRIDEAAVGWNLTSSVDAFLVKPLVISTQIDMGRVGGEFAVQWHASAGVVVRGVELFAALDYLATKSTKVGSPLVGLRLWM